MPLNIDEVKNGRIYSVVFAGPASMNKGGRAGVPENPLLDRVTKRTVLRMQACSRSSYQNRMRKLDPAWQPSDKPSGYAPTMHPCVDLNEKEGTFALRAWSAGVVKRETFVDGRPATPEELQTIADYQPGGKWYPASQPKGEVTFMRLPLAKVEHEGWEDGDPAE